MLWFGLGAAGALVDRDRRGHWVRSTGGVGGAYVVSTSIKLAIGRKRPVVEDLPHLMATPTGLSFPSSHSTSSFAAARAYGTLLPAGPLYVAASAMASRGCTWACTTRPTSPPASRSAASWAHWDDDEGRDRRAAQRGQVLAVQRAQPRRGGGRQLPVHHDRAQRGRRAGRRRAPRRGRGDGRRLQHRAGHDRVPRHRRARQGRPRGRGPGQQVPGQHPRDGRAAARRPLPLRRERHPPGRARLARGGHRDHRDRADLRRPRPGRAPARARGARGAGGDRRSRPRRRGFAGDRGAAGRAARALGARAPRRAERDAQPVAADRQAGPVRRQRRRGRRRRARRGGRPRRGRGRGRGGDLLADRGRAVRARRRRRP